MRIAPLKSCFLGCGPRARKHAEPYEHVETFAIRAMADYDRERAEHLARDFGVTRVYSDFVQMLKQEQPDLVHCVTQPDFRVEPVRLCAEYGVKAIILEKPMATTQEAADEIAAIAGASGIKVIVNTQRRYFSSWMQACQVVHTRLGKVRLINIHTNPALGCIGSHFIDMAQCMLGDVAPESVWATAAGVEDWHTNHPGPSHVLASIDYPGRVNVKLEMSKVGIGVPGCGSFWMSSGLEVLCENGSLWWTENRGWGYHVHGVADPVQQPTDFSRDDRYGQGAFTEAIGQWLLGGEPHGNRLETALRVFRIVGTVIASAAEGRRIRYDDDGLGDWMDDLRAKLLAREGDHPDRVDWESCRDA